VPTGGLSRAALLWCCAVLCVVCCVRWGDGSAFTDMPSSFRMVGSMQDTHTANRDLLYSQWEVFRSLATVLTAGAAGGGEEEEEEEEEEPEGAGSGVVAMEGGEEMEANVEDEEEEGKDAEEDEQDKEDKEEEAAEEEEEEEEEEVDPEVTIGRKRKGKNRAATAPRAKVAKPSPKTRAAKSAPKKKAQPVAVDTEAGPKTLRRSSRRKAK
jgi:outer membrane biosynthesis protein TonB